MTDNQRRGRLFLLVFMALTVLIALFLIVEYWSNRGTDRVGVQVTRFVLTLMLCYWLYRGHPAARWIMIALLCLGGGLAFGLSLREDFPDLLIGLGIAVVYLAFARVLIWSPSVNGFLQYQRCESSVIR